MVPNSLDARKYQWFDMDWPVRPKASSVLYCTRFGAAWRTARCSLLTVTVSCTCLRGPAAACGKTRHLPATCLPSNVLVQLLSTAGQGALPLGVGQDGQPGPVCQRPVLPPCPRPHPWPGALGSVRLVYACSSTGLGKKHICLRGDWSTQHTGIRMHGNQHVTHGAAPSMLMPNPTGAAGCLPAQAQRCAVRRCVPAAAAAVAALKVSALQQLQSSFSLCILERLGGMLPPTIRGEWTPLPLSPCRRHPDAHPPQAHLGGERGRSAGQPGALLEVAVPYSLPL